MPRVNANRVHLVDPTLVLTADQLAAEDPTMCEICDQTRTTEETIEYHAKRGLLANSSTCDACQVPRAIHKSSDYKLDGICWRCTRCRSKRSIRPGSFFADSHMDLRQLALFSYCWSQDTMLKFCAKEAGRLAEHTSVDWANFHRDLCCDFLLANPMEVGGLDFDANGAPVARIVEIDESVIAKRKYNRGRRVEERWVFGGYE